MKNTGFYGDKKVSHEETERLKNFSYPFTVSKEIIGENICGKLVIDIGSGPSTELGLWIEENGGGYIAFDKQKQFLAEQENRDFGIIHGDILSYEFGSVSSDIVHTRFVLMHIPSEDQSNVIRKILSISRERALFLEFDWNTFEDGGPTTSKFRDLFLEFIEDYGSNPYEGANLESKICNEITKGNFHINSKRFHREKDAYYYELIPHMESMIKAMEKMQRAKLEEAKELLKIIELEAEKENSEKFTPPDIVAVTAFRINW